MFVRKSKYKALEDVFDVAKVIHEDEIAAERQKAQYWYVQFHRLAASLETKLEEFMEETENPKIGGRDDS